MADLNIFARFFTFNAFLAVFFIFSKVLFENNHFLSAQFLWIVLMTAIPLGAAAYSRFSSRIDKVLSHLFHIGVIYLVVASTLFLRCSPAASFGDAACLILFICGFVIFGPLWFTVGILEMNLYQILSRANKDTLWVAYLFGVLGLLLGSLIPLCGLPVHSPLWLGILLSALFLVYARIAALRFTWKAKLIAAASVVLLATDSYIRNPVLQVHGFTSSTGVPEIKMDIWGRNMRLTIARSQEGLYGFYNSVQHWFPYFLSGDGFKGVSLYEKLASLTPRHATIAVIGAGGCKQLAPLLLNKPDRIYAIDIVPGLFDVLADLGVAVLEDPRISAVTQDGRKFIEQSRETFDLIFLPRTSSFLMLNKSLFEPSQLLFSLEALQTYRRKLKSNGILAILNWKVATDAALSNYVATLKAAGFEVNCRSTEHVVLILAATNRKTADGFAQALGAQDSVDIAAGKVIVDDKPFYASVGFPQNSLRAILICLALFFLGGLSFFICYPGRRQSLLPPFFCGVNYTLILLVFQLLFFFKLPNPLDAAIVGNLIFLVLVLCGGACYRKGIVSGAAISAGVAGWLFLRLDPSLLLLGLAAMISGGFFPRLLRHFQKRLPFLLVLDGFGAAAAGGLYLAVATVLGVRALLMIAIAIFITTCVLVARSDA